MHIKNVLTALCVAGASLSSLAAEPIWRPTRQTVEEPSDRNPLMLVKSYDSELTYNTQGLPTLEIRTYTSGEKLRIVTTYTSAGRMATDTTSYLKNGEWVIAQTRKREYDPICGAATVSEDYEYDGESAYPGNCFHRNITRNDDGNITEVEIAVYFGGIYDPTRRLTLKYGDDGKPAEITQQELAYDYNANLYVWNFAERYTNLVWDEFNGQVWDVDNLFSGDNRLASGHFRNDNGSKPYDDYDFVATYGENSLTLVMTGLYHGFENMQNTEVTAEETAADGTITYTQNRTYVDLGGVEPTEHYLNTNIIDPWGLELEASEYYWESNPDERELMYINTCEATYDPVFGYPLQYTNIEGGMKVIRVTLSDYIDCADSSGQLVVDSGQRTEDSYYDLLGRPISGPQKGLYIHNGKIIKQ